MATLVKINRNSSLGNEVFEAIDAIKDGLSVLRKLDGTRAQTIGISAETFGASFGIADPIQAQAFSDRWGAAVGSIFGAGAITDFLDATVEE